MSERIEVDAIFSVRSGTEDQWNSTEAVGKGAYRILELGEIGWVIGTNKFKIGDGTTMFKDLDWIIDPDSSSTTYAVRLGSDLRYLTYEAIMSQFKTIQDKLRKLIDDINYIHQRSDFYVTAYDSSVTGAGDAIYIDTTNNAIYRYDIESEQYISLTTSGGGTVTDFDFIQCTLDI